MRRMRRERLNGWRVSRSKRRLRTISRDPMHSHLLIPIAPSHVLLAASIADAPPLPEARLSPATLDGWTAYVKAVEHRRVAEAAQGDRFLALDFLPGRTGAMADVLAGRIITVPAGP